MADEPEVPKINPDEDAVAQALQTEQPPPTRKVREKKMPAVSGGQIKPGDDAVLEDEEPKAPEGKLKGPALVCPDCGNLTLRTGKKVECKFCGFTGEEE